jgi:flagellar hook-associated protein 3 FlgL
VRITFLSTYGKTIPDMNQKKKDVDRLTTMVSSGSRLLKQADDPLAWSQAMDLRQAIREDDAFQKNVDFAVGWNQTTDSALNQMSDLVESAKQQAIQASGVSSPEKRQAQTETLNQIIQQAVNLANSQYQGRYIFSGKQFNSAPFTMVKDSTSGEVLSISGYQGDTRSSEVRVGRGELQTVNLNGQEVFANAGTDVLQQLLQLKNAVRDGNTASIQNLEAGLDSSYQNLQHQTSIVGTRLQALDEKKQVLDAIKIQDQSQLSDVADADMAEAITQLQQKQTVFEAALRVTSLVSNLNLTKYL